MTREKHINIFTNEKNNLSFPYMFLLNSATRNVIFDIDYSNLPHPVWETKMLPQRQQDTSKREDL